MLNEVISSIIGHAGQLGSMIAPILIVGLWRIFDTWRKESSKLHNEINENIKSLKNNDLNIIRSKLHDKIECYIERGSVTWDELQIAEALYDRYAKLGGNSFIATGMEKIRKLPITRIK